MKKLLTTLGLTVFAFAFAFTAHAATFSTDLTIGSQGADVVALQSWLVSQGFLTIPAGTSMGYFGQLTKNAVIAYQQSAGITPASGYVGPITRGRLNSSSVTTTTTTTSTGVMVAGCTPGAMFSSTTGASCSVVMTMAPGCSAGAVYSSTTGQPCSAMTTTTTTTTSTGSITTPGVVGTLNTSLWSTPSGIVTYKGQSYDVASYKVQANASDMSVQNLTLDFDQRLWLYANQVTVRDDSGVIVGQVSNLNQGNFSELTVGSQYRLSVPVNNYIVRSTQIKYLTVNISFLASSDRATGNVNITQAQFRSVDGTGVSDTETVSSARSFSYQGSGAGSIIVTTDSAAPQSGLVQLSTSAQTQNVTLAIFDLKSQNAPSTLRSLNLVLRTAGNGSTTSLFSNVKIMAGGLTYSANTVSGNASTAGFSSSTYSFTSLSIPLGADVYVPIKVVADIAVNTNNTLDGTISSTTLIATGSTGGTSNNPVVEDASFNTLAVNAASFSSNNLTFTGSSVVNTNLNVNYGSLNVNNTTGTTVQTFSFGFTLTAGNNPIYISKTQSTAITTANAATGITVSAKDLSDSDSNGDQSTFFYLSPGQTKTFTASYTATGSSTATGGAYNVTSINFGTSSAALSTGSLTSSDITNGLKAILFH